jgi:predicted chitinase
MASLLARFFGFHGNRGDSRWDGPSSPISPPPDTRPVPATPEADSSTLLPLKNWCHPFKDKRDPLTQLTHLANALAGYYPLGRSGLFHGGVHFDSGTAATLEQSSVHCLADGEVVAYRVDTDSPKTVYFANDRTVEKPFSRNFVLVRHHLQPPKIEGSQDTPPSLTFYSLYMHLQDWAKYQLDSTLARPRFWPERPTFRVKQSANDFLPGQPEQLGLKVYSKSNGQLIDFLPRGAEVAISGTGQFRKLESSLGPAKLLNPDGSIKGYLSTQVLKHPDRKETRISSSKTTVNVRAESVIADNVIFDLPLESEVTVSGEGEFRKLERINQYVQFDSLEGAIEPVATDQIVMLDQPVAIKAGDLIGHLGLYQDGGVNQPDEKLHLETFSGDDVEEFIEASRLWAQRLPEKDRTWLKLPMGTPVVPPEGNTTAALLQASSASSPRSAADLLVPKKLLDDLPADRKIQVPARPTRKARTWYHLKHLLHDADNNLLDGWVCEEPGVMPWVSPWAWEGYGVIIDYSRPKHLLAAFRSTIGRFSDEERERYRAIAEKDDKGPMKRRLYEIIGRKPDGTLMVSELLAALGRPAHAQAISQMVLYKESEWFQQPKIWDALDELLGHSGSTPHLNWLAEKQRIAQMGWWREVAEKVGLPSWGSAYHFHPIGLVGFFSSDRFKFTLKVMKSIYPKLGESRYGDLQKIADELNANMDFFKLDTPLRRTHFFAQIKQETGLDLLVDEDFTYEIGALTSLFSYFRNNPEEARRYGYKVKDGKIKEGGMPMTRIDHEAIANGAYGGRSELGNRGVTSGDGWKYRGRGLKQLTGLHNYKQFHYWHSSFSAQWPNDHPDFVANPDLLLEMKYAVRSAANFWLANKLYEIADRGGAPDIVDLITAIINKHTKSYGDRRANFKDLWVKGALK